MRHFRHAPVIVLLRSRALSGMTAMVEITSTVDRMASRRGALPPVSTSASTQSGRQQEKRMHIAFEIMGGAGNESAEAKNDEAAKSHMKQEEPPIRLHAIPAPGRHGQFDFIPSLAESSGEEEQQQVERKQKPERDPHRLDEPVQPRL